MLQGTFPALSSSIESIDGLRPNRSRGIVFSYEFISSIMWATNRKGVPLPYASDIGKDGRLNGRRFEALRVNGDFPFGVLGKRDSPR